MTDTSREAVDRLRWGRAEKSGMNLQAGCPFGNYYIALRGEYGWMWWRPASGPAHMGLEPTEDRAKAAAQADYEQRILDAINPEFLTRAETAEAERDAGLVREKDANTRAMKHLRRAEKAEIASANHAAFSKEWRQRAETAEARLAEAVEGLRDLRKSAALLQQNAEGCAVNHYGEDFEIHGLPGWLSDTRASIDRASAILAKIKGETND